MRTISKASPRPRCHRARPLILCGLLAAAACSAVSSRPASADEKPELLAFRASQSRPVVLLHGLGRSEKAMWLMKKRLTDAGFSAHAIGYDSRGQSIDEIVAEVDAALEECCASMTRINFVTHSLGGIVLRAWAEAEGEERIGRAVMLSPPNHGSAIVDRLGGLSAALGPTGRELGAYDDSAPNRLNALGPVNFELGVIAGDRSMNPIGSWILDGPDDGTVSVESARVEGMRDFLVMPATHSLILYDENVAEQTVRFVETGVFSHTPEDDPHAAGGERSEGVSE